MEGGSESSTNGRVANVSAVSELILEILGKCGCAGYTHCFQGISKRNFRRMSVQEISSQIKNGSLGSKETHPDMLILIGVHSERIYQQIAKFTNIQNQNSQLPPLVNTSSVSGPTDTKTSATAGISGSDGSLDKANDNDNDLPIFVSAATTAKKIEEIDLGMTSDDDDEEAKEVKEELPNLIPVTKWLPAPEPVPINATPDNNPHSVLPTDLVKNSAPVLDEGKNKDRESSILKPAPPELLAGLKLSKKPTQAVTIPNVTVDIRPKDIPAAKSKVKPKVNTKQLKRKVVASVQTKQKKSKSITHSRGFVVPVSLANKIKETHFSKLNPTAYHTDDTNEEKKLKFRREALRNGAAVKALVDQLVTDSQKYLELNNMDPSIKNQLVFVMESLKLAAGNSMINLLHSAEGIKGKYLSSAEAKSDNNVLLDAFSQTSWMELQALIHKNYAKPNEGGWCFICNPATYHFCKNEYPRHFTIEHAAHVRYFRCPIPACDGEYLDRNAVRRHLLLNAHNASPYTPEQASEAARTAVPVMFSLASDVFHELSRRKPKRGKQNLKQRLGVSIKPAPEGFKESWFQIQENPFGIPDPTFPEKVSQAEQERFLKEQRDLLKKIKSCSTAMPKKTATRTLRSLTARAKDNSLDDEGGFFENPFDLKRKMNPQSSSSSSSKRSRLAVAGTSGIPRLARMAGPSSSKNSYPLNRLAGAFESDSDSEESLKDVSDSELQKST